MLTPSDSAIEGGRGVGVCLRIEPVIGVNLRLVDADVNPVSLKNFFQRWILSGGIMSAFAKRDSSVHSGRRQASAEQNDGRTPFR